MAAYGTIFPMWTPYTRMTLCLPIMLTLSIYQRIPQWKYGSARIFEIGRIRTVEGGYALMCLLISSSYIGIKWQNELVLSVWRIRPTWVFNVFQHWLFVFLFVVQSASTSFRYPRVLRHNYKLLDHLSLNKVNCCWKKENTLFVKNVCFSFMHRIKNNLIATVSHVQFSRCALTLFQTGY